MKNLKEYQEKRNFNKTKEPTGKERKSSKKLRFVVQHHLARKDHYDLRLEWKGTLKSWAVPKGPSYQTKDKRLAIRVEDHPLEYRNFEGTIPKGEYGGGTVMIFDEGYWTYEEEKDINFDKVLKFTLHGTRLRGKWTLISTKDNLWLFIKEQDNFVNYAKLSDYSTSIRTGRTMKEIAEHKKVIMQSKKNYIVDSILISNPDKKIALHPLVTKYDIALYYSKVFERMFPYLDQRITSFIRLPDGVNGNFFYQKHLETKEKGIGKKMLVNTHEEKEDYYYIKDKIGLISEVQMNSYEFHIWGSQIHHINHPNYLVFDLDPDENMALKQVREGVKDLKSILDELHLVSFLKTSGGKGYHVVVPIQSLKSWTSFRNFAKQIAKIMEKKWPDRYISNMRLQKRKNKIFIDWIRNTKGATSVAPYSIRLKKKLAVSMPISWHELDKVKPDGITMQEAIKRLKRKDPWEHFFEIEQ